jgi:hypothetical protein
MFLACVTGIAYILSSVLYFTHLCCAHSCNIIRNTSAANSNPFFIPKWLHKTAKLLHSRDRSLIVVTRLRAGCSRKRGSFPGRGHCFPSAAKDSKQALRSKQHHIQEKRSISLSGGKAKWGLEGVVGVVLVNQKYYLNRCKHVDAAKTWGYIRQTQRKKKKIYISVNLKTATPK